MGEICPRCKHENITGAMLCENCSELLLRADGKDVQTRQVDAPQGSEVSTALTRGTHTFDNEGSILIEFRHNQRNEVQLNEDGEIILGRIDPQTKRLPTIDLGKHEGWERGVSRTHAILRRLENRLIIVDMDSANGTYINDVRVAPLGEEEVRDGDRIKLGLLEFRVFFR